MDLELLLHFCELEAETYQVPYTVYDHSEKIYCSSPILVNIDLLTPNLTIFNKLESNVNYFITENFLIFGYIRSKCDDKLLFIGPSVIGVISDNDIKRIISRTESKMTPEQKKELQEYLRTCSITPMGKFLNALSVASCMLNQEIVSTQQLLTKGIEEKNILKKAQQQLIHISEEEIYLNEITSHQSLTNYEEQISYLIKTGAVDQLNKMLTDFSYNFGKLGPDSLRHFKNSSIILNSLALRAAIAGNLNPGTCYKLGRFYVQQLELCTNIDSLSTLTLSMVKDYCMRVKNEQAIKTGEDVINKSIDYITENCHTKITVTMIAEEVGLSPEYLSSKFKKVTGINLPNFINQKKIQEAQKLLAFTSMSLSDISESLAFSNQSYFQAIFKKVTGITPLAYRKEKNF